MATVDLGEARRPYEMGFVGAFHFRLPPEQLWADIERFDRFEGWWRWLRDLRVEGQGLRDGTVLHGVVDPPVPFRMPVRIELHGCRRPRRIRARVDGAIRGPAELHLAPDDEGGSEVTVGWRLEMCQPGMRAAARAAYPLLRWGHDRVVERAVDGYRRHVEESGTP